MSRILGFIPTGVTVMFINKIQVHFVLITLGPSRELFEINTSQAIRYMFYLNDFIYTVLLGYVLMPPLKVGGQINLQGIYLGPQSWITKINKIALLICRMDRAKEDGLLKSRWIS
jgi:hypothetical protein